MKQTITIEQWNELNEDEKFKVSYEKWRPAFGDMFIHENDEEQKIRFVGKAFKKDYSPFVTCAFTEEEFPAHYCVPLLSIGNLIQLLNPSPMGRYYINTLFDAYKGIDGKAFVDHNYAYDEDFINGLDLVDNLWECYKKVIRGVSDPKFFNHMIDML